MSHGDGFSNSPLQSNGIAPRKSPSIADTKSRFDTLDGLRGIAAIAVMFAHLDAAIFQNAYIAVDLFFMLSGFVIAHSYTARLKNGMSGAEYIKRRVIRLYPMFLISLLVGLPVMLEAGATGISSYPARSVAAATAYNTFFTPYVTGSISEKASLATAFPAMNLSSGEIFPLNPPAWSLFYEMVASIAFLIIVRLDRSALRKLIALSGLLFLFYGAFVSLENHGRSIIDFQQGWSASRLVGGFYQVFFGFTVGVFLRDIKSPERRTGFLNRILGWVPRRSYYLYAIAVGVFAFPFAVRGIYPLIMIFCVAPLLVVCGSKVVCTSRVEMYIARFLGWISYPVYLLHFPVGRAVFMVLGKSNGLALPLFISCVVTLLSAIVLTKFLEEPIRSALTRRFAGPATRKMVEPSRQSVGN